MPIYQVTRFVFNLPKIRFFSKMLLFCIDFMKTKLTRKINVYIFVWFFHVAVCCDIVSYIQHSNVGVFIPVKRFFKKPKSCFCPKKRSYFHLDKSRNCYACIWTLPYFFKNRWKRNEPNAPHTHSKAFFYIRESTSYSIVSAICTMFLSATRFGSIDLPNNNYLNFMLENIRLTQIINYIDSYCFNEYVSYSSKISCD